MEVQKLDIIFQEENILPGDLLYQSYSKNGSNWHEDGWFILWFEARTNKFKRIRQVRAYNVQSLIGNLGGYLGLILGYAILDLPDRVIALYTTIRNKLFGPERSRKIYSIGKSNQNELPSKTELQLNRNLAKQAHDIEITEIKIKLETLETHMKNLENSVNNLQSPPSPQS